MASFSTVFKATRPQFLLLTPVCFMVGGAWALKNGVDINYLLFALAMIGAVAAHIAVNTLNDYYDFHSGLDLITKPTPFSGGSGTIVEKRLSSSGVFVLGVGSLLVAIAIAAVFAVVQGFGVIYVAVPAAALIIFYTQYITRSPLLCLIAPGLGFGPLMCLGAYYAITGSFNTTVLAASVVPGLLVSNLLLLNQFPDVEADSTIGRRVIPGTAGKSAAAVLYAVLLFLTFAWIPVAVAFGWLPFWSIIALLLAPLAFMTGAGVLKNAENTIELVPLMGKNVLLTLLTPVLLTIGMVVSG